MRKIPSVIVYIKNDVYEDLVFEAKEKGISVPRLIAIIVETYYQMKKERGQLWRRSENIA